MNEIRMMEDGERQKSVDSSEEQQHLLVLLSVPSSSSPTNCHTVVWLSDRQKYSFFSPPTSFLCCMNRARRSILYIVHTEEDNGGGACYPPLIGKAHNSSSNPSTWSPLDSHRPTFAMDRLIDTHYILPCIFTLNSIFVLFFFLCQGSARFHHCSLSFSSFFDK